MMGIAKLLLTFSLLFLSPDLYIKPAQSTSSEEWGTSHLKDTYKINDTLYINELSLSANGRETLAKPSLKFPSGKVSDSPRNILNESGKYEVNYSAIIGGKFYEKNESFFVNTPYFSHGEKSTAHYGVGERATHEGLVVSLAKNETISFNEIIDLTDLTKNDQLFRFYFTPSIFGAYDADQLIFTLTDVEDPTNYFEITVGKYAWKPSVNQGQGIIYGKGDDTDRISAESWTDEFTPNGGGSNKGFVVANGSFGCSANISFNGIRRIISQMHFGWKDEAQTQWGWLSNDYENITTADYDATEAIITYDYAKSELGTVSMSLDFKGDRTSETTYKKVWDFDEPKLADKVQGGNGIWRGFTSGKARLSIRADQYESATCNFVLTHVHGLNLKQETLPDTEAPSISIDSPYVVDGVSSIRGKAGCHYTIPEATAKDYYCGETPVRALAYKNYGTSSQIDIETIGDKFFPKTPGEYTIEYSSSDNNGNKAVRLVTVHVDPKGDSDLKIQLNGEIIKSIDQGRLYVLPSVSTTGGRGNVATEAYAVNGDETIRIDGSSFVPEKTGSYTVMIKATDFIGQTSTLTYSFQSNKNSDPFIFGAPTLARHYLAYGKYEVPSVEAYQYGDNGKETIEPTAKVTYKTLNSEENIENVSLSLNPGDEFDTKNLVDGEDVSIEYSYNGVALGSYKSSSVNTVYYDDVNCERVVDYKEYFLSDSIGGIEYDLSSSNGGYRFLSKGNDMDISFANKLLADKFALGMYIAGDSSFDSIKVTLTDSENLSSSVSLELALTSDKFFLCSTGSKSKQTVGTNLSQDNNYLAIEFDGENFVIGSGDVTLQANLFDDGSSFSPFESHKVYLDFELNGFASGKGPTIKRIGNHVFETEFDFYDNPIEPCHDYVEPQFLVIGNKGKYGSINEVASTDIVISQDVFSPSSKAIVTMTSENGDVAKDIYGNELNRADAAKSHEFKFDNTEVFTATYASFELCEGDDYWITQNSKRVEYPYGVVDQTKPIIILTSLMHTSTYVGGTLVLSTFRAEDNVTPSEKLTIIREMILPSGRFQEIPEGYTKFQFNEIGDYEFRIVVIDEASNVAMYSTVITVIEK